MNEYNEQQLDNFYQILHSFLKTVGKNNYQITGLLREFKSLRTEYLEALREKVIPELVQSNDLPNLQEKLNPKQLIALLGAVSASFRSEQEKSYQFLENTLCEELLTKIPQEAMEQGFAEINELRKECSTLLNENEELKKSKFHLEKRLMELEQKYSSLEQQLSTSQEQQNILSLQAQNLQEKEKANQDYEYIITRVRKEVEGKSSYDFWRLKVLYNRIAALTRSSWNYPGTPKPDSYNPNSNHAKQFLDSIKPDH